MSKTKKYKLIKDYPDSPDLGYIADFTKSTEVVYRKEFGVLGYAEVDCFITLERCIKYPEFWEELKVPLFKTNDGVDVYENSEVWFVRVNEPEASSLDTQWMIGKYAGDWYSRSTSNAYKWFSTKEAAEKYVYENKPLYSRKDIDKALTKNAVLDWYYIAAYGPASLNYIAEKIKVWLDKNITKDE